MAPIPDSSYFPSLGKCINGEELLMSWKDVFTTITSEPTLESDHKAVVSRFLVTPEAHSRLSNPFDAFPPPSAQTKAAFDTKTSAINTTPSPNARCDLKELKEDAAWLSQAAKIDELSALRVVTEESQKRAFAQLRGPFSEDELANVMEAAGNSKYWNPIPISLLSRGSEPEIIQKTFGTVESRRTRVIATYFSERQHLLKCTEQLLLRYFRSTKLAAIRREESAEAPSWLDDGTRLAKELNVKSPEEYISRCIRAIGDNLMRLENGSGFFSEEGGREDIEIQWIRTQISEAIHTMEIIWLLLASSDQYPSSRIVLEWFRLQQMSGFLNNYDMEEPSVQYVVQTLQSISCLLTLAFLDITSCIEWITEEVNSSEEISPNVPASSPFFLNTQTMTEITTILLHAAEEGFTTAGPALLAWSLILQTVNGRVQSVEANLQIDVDGQSNSEHRVPPPDKYQDMLERIQSSHDEDIIDFLGRIAVNYCQVFETLSAISLRLGNTSDAYFSPELGCQIRTTVLHLIRFSTRLGYMPEIIEATLSALTGGESYWDTLDSSVNSKLNDPVAYFLQDDTLRESILKTAQSRYPYESQPFLRLIRALAACSSLHLDQNSLSASDFLEKLSVFTYTFPSDFTAYETTQEEENNNTIRLLRDFHMFECRSRGSQSVPNASLALMGIDDLCVRAGTFGRIVSESGPRVACWFHTYSGLKYFGKLLETFLTASDEVDATTCMPADRESVSEIIGILATLLLSIARSVEYEHEHQPDPKADARQILEVASSGLSRNRDITTVIFDIFEEELQRAKPGMSLDVLVNCVCFIHALIPIFPGRIWPLLSQSRLLLVGRGGGNLFSIVESVEQASGRYELLTSCCRLYEALVDDFATHAIRRRSGNKFSNGALDPEKEEAKVETGIPDHAVSQILVSFTRYLVGVLESSCTWKFAVPDDRKHISSNVGRSFNKILRYAYGIESVADVGNGDTNENLLRFLQRPSPSTEDKQKKLPIMSALIPSALQLVDSFLSSASGNMRFQPLLRAYFDGLETPDSTVSLGHHNMCTGQVKAILTLSKTLLQLSTMLGRESSRLETQLFKASPLIARLYATSDCYRKPVLGLLEALIINVSRNASEPPSLLGHLGRETARNLVHAMSDIDRPLQRDGILTAIWHFLSVVVSSRQQWFANYLLSGKTPKDAASKATLSIPRNSAALDRPLLTTALGTLLKIKELPPTQCLAILEFVALAQNFWPWTVCESTEYADFIKIITQYAGELGRTQTSRLDSAIQTRIIAYVAEILAMHMFHSRQLGTTPASMDGIEANLSYFTEFAVLVPSYNASQHAFLRANFDKIYPGCSPQDLKRTTLDVRRYGRDYFYDLGLANQMLALDQAWTGLKENGLREEFARANTNLSLVDAQIALFHSWRFLCIELSGQLVADPKLQRMSVKVIQDCLKANSVSQPPEEIFSRLLQTRTEFALVLAQRLIQSKSSVDEAKRLLKSVWETIVNLRGNFDRAVLGEDVLYYRSLSKLLFLAVRIHSEAKVDGQNEKQKTEMMMNQGTTIVPMILDILKYVVSNGIRELTASVHYASNRAPATTSPEDLALITGIMQSCLRVPGIELCHSQIITIMANNSTARVALNLFSWSDSLAVDGDPIYGELSILFLLELSSMPQMAEQLAIDGLLGHIAAASITSYLRKPGVSPFADGAGMQRCYAIWSRGILPLLLNLLDAVQASIATEVALFLGQFQTLLTQCEQALDAPEMNRIIPKGQTKYITTSICSEIHSMALLTFILDGFRAENPGMEIPKVRWDAAGVLETVEFWVGSRNLLREKLLPMGERETEMVRKKNAANSVGGELEKKVVMELMRIRNILSGADNA